MVYGLWLRKQNFKQNLFLDNFIAGFGFFIKWYKNMK